MRILNFCVIAAGMLLVLLPSPAWANRPLFPTGNNTDASHALAINNVDIAWGIYQTFDNAGEVFWLTFEGKQGQAIESSLIVPAIASLKTYRPTLVLIGPGLPDISSSVSIDLPPNTGGMVFSTAAIESPEVIKNNLADTYAWELFKQKLALPATGRYYLAVIAPSNLAGKAVINIGNRDVFSFLDIFRMKDWVAEIRDFYEAGDDQRSAFFMFLFSVGVVFYCLL